MEISFFKSLDDKTPLSIKFDRTFRIFSELKIIKNKKSKMYLNHEIIGLEYMKKLSIDDSTLKYYQKELIDNKHFLLDKTDY